MSPAPKKQSTTYSTAMDAALTKNPPVVVWRKRRDGIYVKASVYDPHPDGGHNGEKAACKRGHKYTEENTIITADGRQCRTCTNANRKPLTPEQRERANELRRQARERRRMQEEADEVAERFRQHRANNTPLMTAARTEI